MLKIVIQKVKLNIVYLILLSGFIKKICFFIDTPCFRNPKLLLKINFNFE